MATETTPDPAALFDALCRDGTLDRVIEAARAEDLGGAGDVTTQSIVEPDRRGRAVLVAREAGVVAGLRTAGAVLRAFGEGTSFNAAIEDGRPVVAGTSLGAVAGSLAEILTAERTLLNLVGRLSGIATLTRHFVDTVDGTPARICATRKTTPGLRALEKYAVACGGGLPHRFGLSDAALYKDNHLVGVAPEDLAARLATAIRDARAAARLEFVQVEVDTLAQFQAVLRLERGLVDMVLLDNMTPADLRAAVQERDAAAPGVLLEASGGVTLATARACAEAGVDRVSVGALTHSAPCLDIGLDIE